MWKKDCSAMDCSRMFAGEESSSINVSGPHMMMVA